MTKKLFYLFRPAVLLAASPAVALGLTGGHDRSADETSSQLAILNLEGAYSQTWDTVDAEGWADLFTENGTFISPQVGPYVAYQYSGHDQLALFCETVNNVWQYHGSHYVHTPHIVTNGNRAEGWINFEWRALYQGNVVYAAGVYHVFYVRTKAGWRIDTRIETIVSDSVDPNAHWYGYPVA
jgi:hypothetical protein